MGAVTVHDADPLRNVLVDLADLLRLDEKKVLSSTWICNSVECNGERAMDLERVSDTGASVGGTELLHLVSGVFFQVIDGVFAAIRKGEQRPWLLIRAIRSSYYVLVTNDDDFLAKVRERFRDVRDSPEDADYLEYVA